MNYQKLGTETRYSYYLILKSAFSPYQPKNLMEAKELFNIDENEINYFTSIYSKLSADDQVLSNKEIFQKAMADQSGYLVIWVERFIYSLIKTAQLQLFDFKKNEINIQALDTFFKSLPQLQQPVAALCAYTIAQDKYYHSRYNEAIQLLNFAEHVLDTAETVVQFITLLNYKANTYRMIAQYQKSVQYHEWALAEAANLAGISPNLLANVLESFATTKRYLGQYSEAFEMVERAYALRILQQGENHPDLANALSVRLNINIFRGEFNLMRSDAHMIVELLDNLPYNYHTAINFIESSMAFMYAFEHDNGLLYLDKAMQILNNLFSTYQYDVAYLLHNKALLSMKLTNYGKALTYEKESLKHFLLILPEIHPEISTVYNTLGLLYGFSGNRNEAIDYLSKSVNIHKQLFDEKHPDFAYLFNNLAAVYTSFSEFEQALNYYIKASEIYEVNGLSDHPHLSSYYTNLAHLYQEKGNYENSLDYLLRAKRIIEERLGHEHPDMGYVHNNLSIIYNELGKSALSLKHLRKSVELNEKVYGKNHQNVAQSYNNLALTYQEMERFDEALTYSLKSLNIFRDLLGEECHEVANAYNTISFIYRRMKEYETSLIYAKRALELQKKISGNQPTAELSIYYNNAADAYLLVEELDKSMENSLEALDILKKLEKLGKSINFIFLGSIHNSLAVNYVNRNDLKSALKHLHMAEKAFEHKNDTNAPLLITIYEGLTNLYSNPQIKNLNKAIQYAKKLLQIRRKYFANNSKELNDAMDKLADLYYQDGKYRLAAGLLLKTIKYKKAEIYPEVKYTYSLIGRCFFRLGEYMKASEYFFESYDRFIDLDEDTEDYYYSFTEVCLELSESYLKLGRYSDALTAIRPMAVTRLKEFRAYPAEIVYEYVGNMMADTGQHNQAIEYFLKALDELALKDEQPESLGKIYYKLSHSYDAMGNLSKALEYANFAAEVITQKTKNYSDIIHQILLWHKLVHLPNRWIS